MESIEGGRCVFLFSMFSMLSMVKKSFFLIPILVPGNEGCKILTGLALGAPGWDAYNSLGLRVLPALEIFINRTAKSCIL